MKRAMFTRLAMPLLGLFSLSITAAAQGGASCQAASGPRPVQLVELYTSEGCSSCPPADRWLSTLKGQPDVLAAAFHVAYWDHLGWRDRFASAAFTARQSHQQRSSGARYVYTPQVLVNGRDWRRWPELPAASTTPAVVHIRLERESETKVAVQVAATGSAPAALAAWWVLLEDGHESRVKAGENDGATLKHDHVVRSYTQRAAWNPGDGPQRFTIDAPRAGEGGRPARLLFVVTDGSGGVPLQAVQLAC
jgi:hypothetical protein